MPPRSLRRSSFAIPATSQADIAGGSATKVQVTQLVSSDPQGRILGTDGYRHDYGRQPHAGGGTRPSLIS